MIGLDIDTGELDELASELRSGVVSRVIDDVADQAVGDMAQAAQRAVRSAARRHRRTGRLEGSIDVTIAGEGADMVARVSADPVASILVAGQRPHPIEPLAGRVLAFSGPVAGFAAHVMHPGVAPDPFVARGLAATLGEVGAIAGDAARDTAAQVAARLEG